MKQLIEQCDWEITSQCNLKCLHCILFKEVRKELNTLQCYKVINILSNLGCKIINYTGGEPVVRKDFLKILKYSNSKGIENRMFSNGTIIKKSNIKIIKKYVQYIGISIEGLEAENDKIRGKNSFKNALNGIKLLKENNIRFGIYITINKENIKYLRKILSYIKNIGAENISLNQIVFRGRAQENKKKLECKINCKKIINIIKEVLQCGKLKKEINCCINPKRIFLSNNGKIYFCTEIQQLRPELYITEILSLNIDKYTKAIKALKNKNMHAKCPYIIFSSKKVSINLLSRNKCFYR